MPSSACQCHPRDLPSFPTRRSSDLHLIRVQDVAADLATERDVALLAAELVELRLLFLHPQVEQPRLQHLHRLRAVLVLRPFVLAGEDRKSTRLNSSHTVISYAVFCLPVPPPRSTLFPYTTLFRSPSDTGAGRSCGSGYRTRCRASRRRAGRASLAVPSSSGRTAAPSAPSSPARGSCAATVRSGRRRSEEHTSELQSHSDLVCRLLLASATPEIYPLSLHDALPISI